MCVSYIEGMYICTCVFPMWRGGICTYVSDLESCMFPNWKVVCTQVCYTYRMVYMCVCVSNMEDVTYFECITKFNTP